MARKLALPLVLLLLALPAGASADLPRGFVGISIQHVEAHKTRAQHTRMGSDEPEAEDVEAHLKVRAATDDDSDDVEAHRRQA